ncbi:MAG: glycoside hydrolase family protein [Planctomycetota bacterium]|jgi:hypothetical protein
MKKITRREFVLNSLATVSAAGISTLNPGCCKKDKRCIQTAKGCSRSKSDSPTKTPTITSSWTRIIEYPQNHLNDFCIFQDNDGIWHCIGIMGTGTWESEQSLFHCSSKNLFGPYGKHPPLLTENPVATKDSTTNTRPQKHAPFVIEKDGIYYMFYHRPWGTTLCIKTKNPFKMSGLGDVVFEKNDARDICIIKIKDTYLMYYCQYEKINGQGRACIMLRRSKNLDKWSQQEIVYIDTMQTCTHSYLESPYVVARPEGYYLFIRHRKLDEKTTTVILHSDQPDNFPTDKRPWFHELHQVHAPEIVQFKGNYYIARVSGAQHANKKIPLVGGWVDIARLEFL